MKASELRIGNLTKDQLTGELMSVVGLSDTGDIIGYVINGENYPLPEGWQMVGIPLTEEWLLKFGFVPDKWNLDFSFPTNKDHVVSKDGENGWYYGFECYLEHLPAIELKYVHTLQNLYFVLTGEELNY
jgi:hypothetical protein